MTRTLTCAQATSFDKLVATEVGFIPLNGELRNGKVVAVCLSEKGGVPKYPRDAVSICKGGVVGDYHYGNVGSDGTLRYLTVVAKEVFDSVGEDLKVNVAPGDFGENFLIEGVGDLSDIVPGDLICLGPQVVIRVTSQNTPCSNLSALHSGMIRMVVGRRGVLATVETGGKVCPGDDVYLPISVDNPISNENDET